MTKKKCLIYANCQGGAIAHFLQKSPQFKSSYAISYLQNYTMMKEGATFPYNVLQDVDLFIYQPLKKEAHGDYRTDIVKNFLPSGCVSVSFPYLYNDALWPLFKNGNEMVNEGPILELIDQKASIVDIMFLFLSLKIDFRFKERFEKSIGILREKEQACDVKAIDYILVHLTKERLFLTLNHPASGLVVHCTNQILSKLSLKPIEKPHHSNEAQLPGCLPVSPYEKDFFGFTYDEDWQLHFNKKKQGNWKHAYLNRILEIYLRNKRGIKYHNARFQGKLIRSLSKFL